MSNEDMKEATTQRDSKHHGIVGAVNSMRSVLNRVETLTSRAGYEEPKPESVVDKTESPRTLFSMLDNTAEDLAILEKEIHQALEVLESRLF